MALGASLARQLKKGDLPPFVALYGDLGVGKTAFVKGFVSVFCPEAKVKSPTFSLVHEYRGEGQKVFHFDMYRIEGEDDLYSIGYDEYLSAGICLVEWSEKIPFALPERYIKVELEKCDPEQPDLRKVQITEVN